MSILNKKSIFQKPLVSVVIPTYNRAELVTQTINSVIAQSYKNLEIIVVDDCSTDETETAIKNIADLRIRYIKHQKNYGGAKARNTGIESATGKYIAFLDSDDLWMPDKIELQLASFAKSSEPENLVSYTRRKFNYPIQGIYIQRPKLGIDRSKTVADYLFCDDGDIQTSTLMMSLCLAKAVGFRSELKKHQDWDFCLRLEAKGAKFLFLSEPLTIYRNESREDQISRITNYKISINWINEYRSSISSKAVTGFLLLEVFPRLVKARTKKIYSEKIIFDAWIYKIISFSEFKDLTKKVWNYKHYKQRLKIKVSNILNQKLKNI